MFGTIRKHQNWLWGVIITFTVVSFVIYFSPVQKMGNSRRVKRDYGSIDGHVVSEQEFRDAEFEVFLRYLTSTGHWPDEQAFQTMDTEVYQWLLLSRRQGRLGIHIDPERAADLGRELTRSLQRSGINSPAELAKVLERQGLSMGDFERYVHHSLGIQEMIATVGVSGRLATPEEVKGLYIREHQDLATEALFFTASNYTARVTVTPDAIQQFYTNELANYRIPDRVQVNYVAFPISNYLARAQEFLARTNLDEQVEMNYQRYGTNLFKDAKTPEETKKRIREEMIREQASLEARRAANEFARPLLDQAVTNLDAFLSSAKAKGLAVQLMEPFSREAPPKDLEGNEDFVRDAFALGPDNLVAGSFRGHDAVYVIAFSKLLPSEIPPLEKIRERVVADYRYDQAKTLARQAGFGFYTSLTNGLAKGQTFDALCTEAKLKPKSLPPFSISTRSLPELEDQINLNTLKQLAFTTAPGKASAFQMTAEGGVIVYVKAKLPLDELRMRAELPGYVTAVRLQRQQEAFQTWLQQEFSRNVHAQLSRPQPPRPAATPAARGGKKS